MTLHHLEVCFLFTLCVVVLFELGVMIPHLSSDEVTLKLAAAGIIIITRELERIYPSIP